MFYDLFRFYTVFYGGDSLPHFIFYGFSFLIKIISLFPLGLWEIWMAATLADVTASFGGVFQWIDRLRLSMLTLNFGLDFRSFLFR